VARVALESRADHVGASPSEICGNSSLRTTLPPSALWRTRTASITCRAASPGVSGRMAMNSSPPKRPTMSD